MEGNLYKKLCLGVETNESDPFRKVEKILAPFMRTLKKRKREKADIVPGDYEKVYLTRAPRDLLGQLRAVTSDLLTHKTLLNETAELLKVVTKSKSVNLYLVDTELNELLLCPKYVPRNPRYERRYRIESGTYLAAHVAFTKEYVISSDILGDVRFPQGIPEVSTVKSALCIPIVTNPENNCIGVIELYRDCSERPYDLNNLQICTALTAWMGIAMEENRSKTALTLQIDILEQISLITSMYFSGFIAFPKVVCDVVKVAKIAGSAERGAFYVFHEPVPTNSKEFIYADAYEESGEVCPETVLYKKGTKVRFGKNNPGIAGHVARTGEVVNIRDAYKDPRFDKKTDSVFVRTRSVVGFPIKNDRGVIAVLVLINNTDYPYFKENETKLIESFLSSISLVVSYFLLDNTFSKMQHRLIITDKLLDYHIRPTSDEVMLLRSSLQQDFLLPENFFRFDFDLFSHEEDSLKLIVFLFQNLEPLSNYFEINKLIQFLFRVKKSYRNVTYHNFDHAVSVFHFTLAIIINTMKLGQSSFRPAEIISMLLAALCHDVDHAGLTNNFITLKNDPISKLYGEFAGEAHRYNLTAFIIQQSELLVNFDPERRELILKNLKKLILGFDFTLHFQFRRELIQLINQDTLDWDNPEHRFLVQHVAVFVSDYSYNFKSYDCAKKETIQFYKELYQQGDMEKTMGFTPTTVLDRKKNDLLPENQKILLTILVMPCTQILGRLYPPLTILETLLENTLSKWNEIIALRGLEMWNLNTALATDKTDRRSRRVTVTSTMSSIKTVSSHSRTIFL